MNINNYEAMFFVFEGMPGCGKEKLFSDIQLFLENNDISGVLAEEPTKVLPNSPNVKFKKIQKVLAENRLVHMEKFIIPHLILNEIVGVSNYFPNSAIFGSKSENIEKAAEVIMKDNKKLIVPDVIFFVKSCFGKCFSKTGEKITRDNLELWQFRLLLYKKVINSLQKLGAKLITIDCNIETEKLFDIFQKHCCFARKEFV